MITIIPLCHSGRADDRRGGKYVDVQWITGRRGRRAAVYLKIEDNIQGRRSMALSRRQGKCACANAHELTGSENPLTKRRSERSDDLGRLDAEICDRGRFRKLISTKTDRAGPGREAGEPTFQLNRSPINHPRIPNNFAVVALHPSEYTRYAHTRADMTAISISRGYLGGETFHPAARGVAISSDVGFATHRARTSESYDRNYYYCITHRCSQLPRRSLLRIPVESIALQWFQGDSDNSHRARDVIRITYLAKK